MSFMVDVGVLDHVTKHKKGFKAVRLYRFYLHETQHRQMNRDKVRSPITPPAIISSPSLSPLSSYCAQFWHSAGRDAGEVAIMLLNIIIDLLKKFKKNGTMQHSYLLCFFFFLILDLLHLLSSADGSVNWEALRASDEWKKWSLQTSELQKVDVGKLSKEAKRAFFVNVYSATSPCLLPAYSSTQPRSPDLMVLHAHSKFGPPTTMLERKRVQEELCYNVGGHEYTLEIIDNWILRGELPHSVLKAHARHLLLLHTSPPPPPPPRLLITRYLIFSGLFCSG
jgi:hypothetical protein